MKNVLFFISILFYVALPELYNIFKLKLFSFLSPDNGVLIVIQSNFYNLFTGILKESLLMPIVLFLSNGIKKNKLKEHFSFSFFFITLLLSLFAYFAYLNIDFFINFISVPQEIAGNTRQFFLIKNISFIFTNIVALFFILIEIQTKSLMLFAFTILKILLQILFDLLFYSKLSFSFDYGSIGIAYSELASSLFIFFIALIYFLRNFFTFRWPSLKEIFLNFFTVGFFSGLDSAIRNISYYYMILILLNKLGQNEIAGYYASITILGSILILLSIAIAESNRIFIANAKKNHTFILLFHLFLNLIATFLIFYYFYFNFKDLILDYFTTDNIKYYTSLSLQYLLIPYFILTFNNIIKTIFYALGKTIYLFLQSLITNLSVYGTAYLLYYFKVYEPDFTSILIIFSMGIVIDTILTIIFAFIVLKKRN